MYTYIRNIYNIYLLEYIFFLKSNKPCSFCVIFITNCPYSEKSSESCLICSIQQLVASYKSQFRSQRTGMIEQYKIESLCREKKKKKEILPSLLFSPQLMQGKKCHSCLSNVLGNISVFSSSLFFAFSALFFNPLS